MELNLDKIEKELRRRGWSKVRLAREMGEKRQWPYAILKASKADNLTLRTVTKIAKALDFDPKDLLT